MIIKIGELQDYTLKDLGGKAFHLCKLKNFGFNVPSGFILTPDWFDKSNKDDIDSYIDKNKLYAVRSSAIDEDGPNFSFAGLQDTYLNVEPSKMYNMINKCYQSQWSERANSYREKYDIHKSKGMSVIVQEMVDADFAGVMFTQHPLSNRIDEIAIDVIAGLGEDLVSGVKTPSNYTIDKESRMLKSKQIHSIELSEHQIKELCITAIEIENFYESPQDIEWAFLKDKLYILQSRPITTTFRVPKSKFDGKRIYLSFGHVQNMTRPFTPVGADMISSMFNFNANYNFSDYILYNGSYVYIDITELTLMSNFAFKRFQMSIGNINNELPKLLEEFRKLESRRTKANLKFIFLGIPKIKEIISYLRGKAIDLDNLEQITNKHIDNYKNCDDLSKLLTIRKGLLITTFQIYLPIIFTGIISYKLLERLFIKWDLDMNDFHALLSGVDGNKTTEMGLLYGDIINNFGTKYGDELLDRYIKVYGMRVEGEIDLGRKRPLEDLDLFIKKVESDSKEKPSLTPRERHTNYKNNAKQVEIKLKSQLPSRKWKKLNKYINLMQTFIVYREHPKFTIMNIFQHYRSFIKSPFMTFNEDQNNLIDKNDISYREALYKNSIGKMPPLIILSNGQILKKEPEISDDGHIKGFGVSSGKVIGTVRVIKEIGDSVLKENEILVTQFTDPGWTTTMARASGVIIEVGGMMTHGAVVAREYGIPAIVGVENATTILKTGDKVIMDGSSGSIEILVD